MIWTKHKRYMLGWMRWTDNPFEFHSLWKCSKESSEESIMLVYKKKWFLENASSLSSMLDKLKAFLRCCLSTLCLSFLRDDLDFDGMRMWSEIKLLSHHSQGLQSQAKSKLQKGGSLTWGGCILIVIFGARAHKVNRGDCFLFLHPFFYLPQSLQE